MKAKLNNIIIPIILILFLFSGCTIIRKEIGTPIDTGDTAFIEEETDISEVLQALGPPDELSSYAGGVVFLYEYVYILERQLGLGAEEGVAKWIQFSLASSQGDRQVLVLIFDDKGVLKGWKKRKWNENFGKGVGLTLLISAESLVDTSDLEQEPRTLTWGTNLLDPLPTSLNRNSSLDTGISGLEQRGTSTNVGQHSLEFR